MRFLRFCQARNRKGNPCGTAPLKGEDYCVAHSLSTQAKMFRQKGIENQRKNRKLKFDERGLYTTYGMCQVLISQKKKLLRDKTVKEKVRIPLLIRLDRAITRKQEKLLEEERLKKEERNYVPFHVRLKQALIYKLRDTVRLKHQKILDLQYNRENNDATAQNQGRKFLFIISRLAQLADKIIDNCANYDCIIINENTLLPSALQIKEQHGTNMIWYCKEHPFIDFVLYMILLFIIIINEYVIFDI